MVGRIRRQLHEQRPLPSAISGLLVKFPHCSLKRRFPGIDHTCHQFVVGLPYCVPVLVLHHELPVFGDRNDIDPVGKLQNEPFRDNGSRRKLHPFLPEIHPSPLVEQFFALQDLPLAVFRFLYHKTIIYPDDKNNELPQDNEGYYLNNP